ncbi:hypothetical protein FRC17_009849 [Serendipita sp. 399]|nr:hypothetical protein FRC17_009849 [Serendipita sp. 399]
MAIFNPILDNGPTPESKGGRGGGGSSLGSISDNWDAPPQVKAQLAALIIWCIIIIVQFGLILTRLKFLPTDRIARAPYILLSIVAICTAFAYLLWSILLRVESMSSQTATNINALTSFLFCIDTAFRPAVLLWLVHIRGQTTYRVLGKQAKLWVTQFWKRIVDWSLVAITFLFGISAMAVYAQYRQMRLQLTSAAINNYIKAYNGLSWTVIAFSTLLSINVIVSLVTLKVSQGRAKITDLVIHRLVIAAIPFIALDVFMDLFVNIYTEVALLTLEKYYGVNLASAILSGIARVGIIGVLLSTMKLPQAITGGIGGGNVHPEVNGGMPPAPLPPMPGLTYTNQQAYYPAPAHPPPNVVNQVWQQQPQQPQMMQQQGVVYQPPFGNPYNNVNPPAQQPQQPYTIPA